jgi:hypothetical protein
MLLFICTSIGDRGMMPQVRAAAAVLAHPFLWNVRGKGTPYISDTQRKSGTIACHGTTVPWIV